MGRRAIVSETSFTQLYATLILSAPSSEEARPMLLKMLLRKDPTAAPVAVTEPVLRLVEFCLEMMFRNLLTHICNKNFT
jgi:hypothetical protein